MANYLQVALLCVFSFSGVLADNGIPCQHKSTKCTSVADTAKAVGLNTLLAAVDAAGLTETVNDPDAGLTIFAPTDAAFSAALAALGITAEELLGNVELLTQILTYHVLPTPEFSASLASKGSAETLLGDNSPCGEASLSFKASDDFTVKGGATSAKVTTADVKACSSVVHVIDAVLLPCPITKEDNSGGMKEEKAMEAKPDEEESCLSVKEAAEAAGLTSLLLALTAADLVGVVNAPGAELTIFAPTDAAFTSALESLGVTFEDLAGNKDLLTQILTYHVLPSAETSTSLAEKGSQTTLLGDKSACGVSDLSFMQEDEGFKIVGGESSAAVIVPDVKTCTSVVHVIDNVLLACPV